MTSLVSKRHWQAASNVIMKQIIQFFPQRQLEIKFNIPISPNSPMFVEYRWKGFSMLRNEYIMSNKWQIELSISYINSFKSVECIFVHQFYSKKKRIRSKIVELKFYFCLSNMIHLSNVQFKDNAKLSNNYVNNK